MALLKIRLVSCFFMATQQSTLKTECGRDTVKIGVTIFSYLCWVVKTQFFVKLHILQEFLCPNMENPDWVSASTLQKIRESVPAVRAGDRGGKAIAILVILQVTIGYNYILVVCA